MQNVAQGSTTDNPKIDKVNVHHDLPSTPHSTSNSSPAKSETETYSEHRRYMSDSSDSEEDSVSEVDSFVIDQEYEEDPQVEAAKFLLSPDEDRSVDPETQARLEALLQAAGIGQLAQKDGKHLADPEVLRRLTSSVSCALDEAAAALSRMRTDNSPRTQTEKISLVEACTDGDVGTVRKLLTEGRSVHETSEEGESLLSLACSAGYFELAQVLLAMHANVEDRGIKGECTPLMEAASAGHLDIVRLLVAHGADVNAQSTSGNTPLMYGCAGGHQEVVKFLLENGANVEDHNENGHTPLMEAASAGHVGLAKTLLEHGAGINTHSNEFKESALTLACYKGHLDMVRFLLEAGADQEHKTDEMHTALMEASMDGHVEVARLLLDSGAQVNMPTDSFESPLTLAACGGHVDLAMLLIERGANIEEVNDEGYTPLMEAAREGHEEMVALLLSQGANINAQTDETQETALTLACCGGFTEVADFLIKAGADIELGASTPLMEAAQEGHLELVKYLLENNANVHAQTQTGDTALTYACENGHTDVADLLLQYGADLEHESEGGRTPLMKGCRAGHLCTVQFLISKGANVRRQTTNNDHTPLSLACAGGHLQVVELLLAHRADPNHKLKDNSTMLIEAAKGGHTSVVQLLLDYPHSLMLNQPGAATATNLSMLPGQVGSRDSPLPTGTLPQSISQPINFLQPPPCISSTDFSAAVLQEVPEAVRIAPQEDTQNQALDLSKQPSTAPSNRAIETQTTKTPGGRKSLLPKSGSTGFDGTLTSSEAQQVRTQPLPLGDFEDADMFSASATMEFLTNDDPGFMEKNGTLIDFIKNRKKQINIVTSTSAADEGSTQKQQILEELQRVERELHGKQQHAHNHLLLSQYAIPQDQCPSSSASTTLPHMMNIDIASQQQQQQQQQQGLGSSMSGSMFPGSNLQVHNTFYTGPGACIQPTGVPLKLAVSGDSGTFTSNQQQAFYFAPLTSSVAVSLSTATSSIVSQPIKFQTSGHEGVSQHTAIGDRPKVKPVSKKEGKNSRKQQQYQPNLYGQQQGQVFNQIPTIQQTDKALSETLSVQGIDLDSMDSGTNSLFQQYVTAPVRAAFVGSSSENLTPELVEDVVRGLDTYNINEVTEQSVTQHHLQVQPYPTGLEETMIASLSTSQDLGVQSDVSQVEYFAVPPSGAPLPVQVHNMYPYDQYLQAVGKGQGGALYQAGFQAGINLMQQQLACPNNNASSATETLTTTTVVPTTPLPGPSAQPYQPACAPCTHVPAHHCQAGAHQVQAATQTSAEGKKPKAQQDGVKIKKGRVLFTQRHQHQPGQGQPAAAGFQVDGGGSAITQYGGPTQQCASAAPPANYCMDVDSETESNHDTALTLGCAGGHEELVELLLTRGADIEHRDKKGFTPLILAATAGHEKVVEILLNHNADIEAQSERTKDTPLSLACSGGRYEVVELLLNRNANKEHRNVSDYTPLSLAASGGYVNIIKLLLNHGAEINSRTGSKLGISPLMLAAMNGHTAAVKLLLDMGSDINAQIETNRNTALTLACFQGRHEVVSLLLDRKANVEHRAKTGLTPLMEAASGGYVEVGRVLLDKGADVNATPVPSSRDTALTIAADKGHVRFVELLLYRGAAVEVKNKKGNSPLWLAANGGHLAVVELLYNRNANIDSQDNRKVSCLMAAFRKGHTKVVKWMVNHVEQFPSDQEMVRYITTVSDKELIEKCHECIKVIRAAKETQAAKANKNASILLEELDMEKNREESKKAAAARRRERKKKKKLEKKEEKRKLTEENKKNESYDDKDDKKSEEDGEKGDEEEIVQETLANDPSSQTAEVPDKEEGDSGIDANSQGSCSSNDVKAKDKRKEKKKKKSPPSKSSTIRESQSTSSSIASSSKISDIKIKDIYMESRSAEKSHESTSKSPRSSNSNPNVKKALVFEASRHPAEREDFEATGNETYVSNKNKKSHNHYDTEIVTPSITKSASSTSPKQAGKREEGWKEVVRKSSVQTVSSTESGVKKVSVPLNAISRVIGRGGSNINAIRGATGAHIEVEKQSKGQGERIITIKGSADATKQAHSLIATLIKDPDVDILQMLPKTTKASTANTTLWDKTQIGTKKVAGKVTVTQPSATTTAQKTPTTTSITIVTATRTSSTTAKPKSTAPTTTVRVTAPRLAAAHAEKNAAVSRTAASHASSRVASKVVTTTATQTFAAKLTETGAGQAAANAVQSSSVNRPRNAQVLGLPSLNVGPTSPQMSAQSANAQSSPKHHRPAPTASAPPNMQHYQAPTKAAFSSTNSVQPITEQNASLLTQNRSSTPVIPHTVQPASQEDVAVSQSSSAIQTPSEYSLFNSMAQQPMWRRENESQKPVNFAAVTGGSTSQASNVQAKFIEQETTQVDVTKAPGYRGTAVCSPVSSKTSSNSTTPPNLLASGSFQCFPPDPLKPQTLPPIGSAIIQNRPTSQANQNDISTGHFYGVPDLPPSRSMQHLAHSDSNVYKSGGAGFTETAANMLNMSGGENPHLLSSYPPMPHFSQPQQPSSQSAVSMSRLNPKAPDFSSSVHVPAKQTFNGYMGGAQNGGGIFGMQKTYQRTNVPSHQRSWQLMQMQQPFTQQQSELISGMATGMTLHSLARATGGEILENGGDLVVNSSPSAMSPNLGHAVHGAEGHFVEDRKQPQPIGTERARKIFNPVIENWVMGTERNVPGQRWTNSVGDRYAHFPRAQVLPGDEGPPMMMDSFQPNVSIDSNPNFGTHPLPYYLQQHPGPDFLQPVKMDVQWDAARSNVADLSADKLGWTTLTNKWNQ